MSSNRNARGKPITTSVPSFAIRFQAGGEEIEELFPDDEEEKPAEENATPETSKQESSPMRDYFNKFGKRSSSIDTGINDTTATSTPQPPPSDPWRIFSEFKGKLTKTVEEKLCEIKSKNENESSPCKKGSNSKDNSSLSDSEEPSFSECSVPKCLGVNTISADMELSSDDETSLVESERTPTDFIKDLNQPSKDKHVTLRHRFRSTNKSLPFVKESAAISMNVLASKDKQRQANDSPLAEDEVESGVEAYEEFHTKSQATTANTTLNETLSSDAADMFVDVRTDKPKITLHRPIYRSYKLLAVLCLTIVLTMLVFTPAYFMGYFMGIITATVIYSIHLLKSNSNEISMDTGDGAEMSILEIPAVKEFQPVTKFQGWLNEYPENYNPTTYHIMKTQSVYVKLEGNIIRISYTRAKIPKRAMWNEPKKHNVSFVRHKIYNLRGAQVLLLPRGLTYKRIWSKKYPICVILNKENMRLDLPILKKNRDNNSDAEVLKVDEQSDVQTQAETDEFCDVQCSYSDNEGQEKKKTDDEEGPSPPSDVPANEDNNSVEDWDSISYDDSESGTKFYFFGRTGRDKEDWYRRLVAATRSNCTVSKNSADTELSDADNSNSESLDTDVDESKAEKVNEETEYVRFMSQYNNQVKEQLPEIKPQPNIKTIHSFFHKKRDDADDDSETELSSTNAWFNSLIGRVLFDVFHNSDIINQLQDRIQRKLSTIKLPYFIEELVVSELLLGNTSPVLDRMTEPRFDERGLWIDMDVTYRGLISMALGTKLNLIKLKEQAGRVDESITCDTPPPSSETVRSPMFNSDVEDSAESSSDDDASTMWMQPPLSDSCHDVSASKANGSKKFLRMVDKIASSKYFQHAAEYKYIKRAMEGVSRTELKLKVELRAIDGTLTFNVPPPPSDRLWIGFRGNPRLSLSASPAFGDRSLNFMYITGWIEKKLTKEFEKFLVLPNMEDFVIPIMNPRLPS